jgi:LacI family gluconate utilization system Gnt-I transcriptional repressor
MCDFYWRDIRDYCGIYSGMSTKLTLKDVATAANVSEMTASRALRDAADVSAATRQRVKDAAAELGYVPNRIAGALASNKVNLVGVVIPSVKSYVFSEVLDGISMALEASPLRPVFGVTNYDLDTEADVIRDMLAWRPAGLIVAGLEHSAATRKMLHATGTPLVEVMDLDGDAIDSCVGISHFQAGFDMAKAIVGKGHKNIGFLGTKMPLDYRATKRYDGFAAGLKDAGITLMDEEFYSSGSTVAKGRDSTAEMLQRHPDIECIYCSTDVIAMGAVMHCIKAGVSIPDQLAIAGFNALSMAEGLPIDLATTDSMRFEIGKAAAEMILLRNQPSAPQTSKKVVFKPEVCFGDSI